jgi:signal transduction histidine kinase
MITSPFLRSSASRGLLLIMVAFVVATATLGVWFFGLQKDHIRTDARNKLQAIADLKVESIRRWRQERLGDAQWIFEASNFPSRVREYLARGDDEIRRAELLRWMEGWRRSRLYSRLLLLDTELQVRLAVPAGETALEPVGAAAARTALRERRIMLADLHRETTGGSVAMDLVVPLVVGNGNGIPVGMLAFEIDPSRFIFPHIQTWPTPSATGETLLVRRDGEDVVYLNTLRHRPDTALKLRVPTSRRELPGVRAALGEEGMVEGRDYRGEPVLAALRAVPDSPWFLVAKQDLSEIDQPVRQWAWLVGGAVLVLTGAAATGTGFLWRTREVHHSREQMAQQARSEAALRESKAQLDLALDAARMGVWRYEVATQRRDYDERACRLLGIDRASFDGTSERFYQHLHPVDRPVVQAALKRTIEDGAPYDIAYRAVWADGTVRHLAARGTLERDDTGRPRRLNGLLWDVTEMRLAEEAARAGEAELRALYAAMTEMVAMHEVVTDAAGRPVDYRILDCNAAYERITGIPRARAVGTLASELYGTNAPPYLDVYARVGLTGEPAELETYFPPMGKHFAISIVSPQRGFFATVTTDITERKHAEEERELLLHELARKNEELEGMLYVASHDLRAPLVNVQGFGGRLEKACAELVAQGPASAAADAASPASRIVKALGYIRASAGKMDGLINGLLRVSRLGRVAVNLQTVDMDRLVQVVRTTLEIQAQQAGAAIELGPLPPCRGDPQLLGQVFTNLLDNALNYRDPARPLRVTVSGRIEGREVFYCVADTGMGIAPEHQNKIWEMFHRLYPEGPAPGEGLGLKIVRRILDRHRGRIWVESRPGEGSRFYVALPLADKPGSAQETPEGDLQ